MTPLAVHLLPLAEGSVIQFGGHFVAKVTAHTFAFLLFVWVLRRYAFGPLTRIMDQRRRQITDELDKIDGLRVQATALEKKYEDKLRDIDAEARRHMQEAVAEGRRVREEILERAREEGEELRLKQQRAMELDLAKARIELRDAVVKLTLAATEKLLGESVDSERNRRLVSEFVEEVKGLPGGDAQN